MKLLRTKIWCWTDIVLLKWSALLVGIVVGGYFHEFVARYAWLIIISALLLAFRPAVSYWKD